MNRNILAFSMIGASVAVFAAGAAFAQTVDGPRVNWKLATWGKARAFTAGIETLRDQAKEKTGGKFVITIGYESMGGPKEILDTLSVGGLEATTICSSYHPEKHPAYTGLDLPFLPLPTFDVQNKVHDAYHAHPAIVAEMKKWNAQLFMSNLLPQYEFIGKGKLPKSLDDWKGMRVRAIGGIGEAMRNLGAVPTSVDATEVYGAIERGTVDAVSFPSTYAHGSYKTYEVGKWFTANLAPGTQACPTLFNVNAWAKLPDAYKKILIDAKPLATENLKKAYGAADDRFIPLFKQKGLEFITYSDADLAKFRQVGAKPVWDKWVQEMSQKEIPGYGKIPAQELLDLILKTAEQAAKAGKS